MIKENGGLTKLVAFITDSQPPEEDDKKGGGAKDKKGAASRAGKKGKDDGMLPTIKISSGLMLLLCTLLQYTCGTLGGK